MASWIIANKMLSFGAGFVLVLIGAGMALKGDDKRGWLVLAAGAFLIAWTAKLIGLF